MVAQEAKDILAKWLTQQIPATLLAALGLDVPPIVEVLPTEVPMLSVHLEQPDVLLRLADGRLIDLEFQMKGEPDLWRFLHYTYAAVVHHQAPTQTVVVYGPGIASAPEALDLGSLVFRVTNVFLGQQEAEEVLAELGAKRAQGEVLGQGAHAVGAVTLDAPAAGPTGRAAAGRGALGRSRGDRTAAHGRRDGGLGL
jgi:hypothetical protein